MLLGPQADQRFDVDLVEDADGGVARYRRPFWIALPHPVPSSCVTVVIRDAGVGTGSTAIADVDVMTVLDGPDGLQRLVDEVAAGGECEARAALLVSQGDRAARAVAAGVVRAAGPGRECLLEALSRLVAASPAAAREPAVGEAVAGALVGATAAEERLVMAALAHLSDAPVVPLGRLLGDDAQPEADRLRAARALAALEQEGARQALLRAAGRGPEAVRARVRELLAQLHGPFVAAVRAALAQEGTEPIARRSDLLYALGALAAREPAERAAAVEVLRAAYEASSAFEIRARAIAALGRVGDGAASEILARIRDGSPDPVLRYLATRELATAKPELALPALRAALRDGDPRVRETAALALGRLHDSSAGGGLIAAAKEEPWPFVRRAQVEALGELCGPGAGDLLVRANERDREEVRRAALIGLARCRDPRARDVLLRVLGRAAEEAELRALAARLLPDLHDCGAAHEMAAALARLQVESQADLALEGVAVATVHALAVLGGREAVDAALGLLRDQRPALRRAAVEALGRLCADPAAAAAALQCRTPAPARCR